MNRAGRQTLLLVTFAWAFAALVGESVFAQRTLDSGATEYMIEMRDGVKLATNVFLPKGDGPWPVILTRTPYNKDGGLTLGSDRYSSGGYVYVAQDCRGRLQLRNCILMIPLCPVGSS